MIYLNIYMRKFFLTFLLHWKLRFWKKIVFHLLNKVKQFVIFFNKLYFFYKFKLIDIQ